MATPLNIQHDFRRFELGALASFSARPVTSRHRDDSLAGHAIASPIEALVRAFPSSAASVGISRFSP